MRYNMAQVEGIAEWRFRVGISFPGALVAVHGPLSRCLMYRGSVFLASLSGLERLDRSLG